MRLFLVAVLASVLAGCPKGDELKSAALKVQLHYEGFRPGCVTLTVTDQEEVSRQVTTNVNVSAGAPPGTLSVAVFRQAGWSNDVKLLARAHEQSCEGAQVATAEATASLAKDGITPVDLLLGALDADGDGFVRKEDQGTDCDDRDPDRKGPTPWYEDLDGDNYGNRLLPPRVTACEGPALTASRTGDCDDRDPSVHPDQAEFRCDGRDDNCDDVKDESFDVGGDCFNDSQCPGANVCGNGGVVCNSTVTPTAWYVDEDGDGKAGAEAGRTCGPVPAGTSAVSTDCDESTVHVANGLPEVCDRLDNNCAGGVDEGATCATLTWRENQQVDGDVPWNAITLHGTQGAWFASKNKLAYATSTTLTSFKCGGDWKAAWTSSTGRVFLAGANGELTTRTPADPTGTDCVPVVAAGNTSMLNGIVGLEQPAGSEPVLYAVASNGNIVRWRRPDAPTVVTQVPANLRAIDGLETPDTLMAVGFVTVGSQSTIRVFRSNSDGSAWQEDSFNPPIVGSLRGVDVVNSRLAFVAGDDGLVLQRYRGAWSPLPQASFLGTRLNALDVQGLAQGKAYMAAGQGGVFFFDGSTWLSAHPGTNALRSLDSTSPTNIGVVGDHGTVIYWRP
ncbi:BNR repeat domain protein [Corallococcus coralloides DSM 2259]|uniref:BNR repeat domain protein n=1 Tax=Corallococcus coralloides (strain ATCC 25202 / DSM 2259 / NBRC 100086 / M2) TaxID=1144275 RepID=H8MVU7_CORCM|nr:putative metal-binding motif-containing protein [Corallococcus coralloides]AFE05616.1 BNR repeat domain protein [Corallococcus coralloides DSM 2259]